MLQTLCDNEEIDIMPISIISNNLSILFGRCSWRALIIFVNESEKLGRVNTMVTAIEKVYFLQDMKSKVVQGTIMDLTIVLSRISAIKSLSFTDQKLLEVMVHILRSELSLECKCRATTILANLTMQNLGNLTMDNIVTALDAISDAMKETNKCTTDSELTKLLHQECWRLIFHLTTHPQSRQFIVQRQIVQRFLLTALLNEEACVHHNGLFAAEVLKTMSYDPATVDILIRNGRIIEILKKKARFEKDLRTRNVCLSALCQIVESKPAEFVQHPEILKFFSIAAINNNIMSHVSFEVKRSFCRIARESWPLLKGYSTMVNSLFAISRDFADARTILLEFASKESHRRAMVEEDTAFMKWKQGLLQDENHVLFMTKCLGEEHCDVSKLVHNSQEEYATFYKTFSKGVIPDRKLKNMICSYNAFPFELNFTVHDEALLMITLENDLKKWKFELEVNNKYLSYICIFK